MSLGNVNIYRMTHIANVPYAMQHGITHKNSAKTNPDYVVIGDVSLIETRSRKQVSVFNGDDFSMDAETITLGDFIPFYFGVRMPMLYVMQHGGNFVEKATPPEDIVYLACSLSKVVEAQSRFYFTDGHATDGMTTFYDRSMVGQLTTLLDWNAIRAKYWSGEENLNTKRKKQAEFLAADDVPFDHVVRLACYNEAAKQKLLGFGIADSMIQVLPRIYY